MARVADYVIISDKAEKMVRGGTNFFTRKFTIPDNFSRADNCILMFMVDTDEPDALHYALKINNQEVASYTHNVDRFGTFHEVFGANLLHTGENDFTAVATSGEGTIKISDVVCHFQVFIE
jgi:hypothetical protein